MEEFWFLFISRRAMKDASIYAVVRSQPPSPPRRSSHALPSFFLPSLSRRGQCHYSFPLDKSKAPKKKGKRTQWKQASTSALIYVYAHSYTRTPCTTYGTDNRVGFRCIFLTSLLQLTLLLFSIFPFSIFIFSFFFPLTTSVKCATRVYGCYHRKCRTI